MSPDPEIPDIEPDIPDIPDIPELPEIPEIPEIPEPQIPGTSLPSPQPLTKYSGMKLSDLRKEDRGLLGNLLLAKLEAANIVHKQQNYVDAKGKHIEPKVTKYLEKEADMTAAAFINFLTDDNLYWTISELKASVELEEIMTVAPLNTKVDTKVNTTVASGIPTQGQAPGTTTGTGTGKGSGKGKVTEPLQMRKDGGKHGGRLRAIGHAYIGDPDIVPNSDTKEEENEFTKVKLYLSKIPWKILE